MGGDKAISLQRCEIAGNFKVIEKDLFHVGKNRITTGILVLTN